MDSWQELLYANSIKCSRLAQSSQCQLQQIRKNPLMPQFQRSICPLVQGWKAVKSFLQTLRQKQNVDQNLLVNTLPQSNTMSWGIPQSLTQCLKKILASSSTLMVFLHGIYFTTLVYLSTITSMELDARSQPSSILGGRSIMKSMLMDLKGFSSKGSAYISLYSLCQTVLVCQHISQPFTYSFTSLVIFAQQYLRQTSSSVFLVLKCPARGSSQQILRISMRTAQSSRTYAAPQQRNRSF